MLRRVKDYRKSPCMRWQCEQLTGNLPAQHMRQIIYQHTQHKEAKYLTLHPSCTEREIMLHNYCGWGKACLSFNCTFFGVGYGLWSPYILPLACVTGTGKRVSRKQRHEWLLARGLVIEVCCWAVFIRQLRHYIVYSGRCGLNTHP